MKTTVREDEYRVSERVVLRHGDVFLASGGPYWKSSDGQKISLRSKGPYRFSGFFRRGRIGWIEAFDKDGAFAVLHVEGKRKRIDGSLVARPYTVTRKKRPPIARA